MNAYLDAFKKYATFSGRATRKQYWLFALFHFLILIALYIIDAILGTLPYESSIGFLSGIYALAAFIPNLALSVRRLHDTNRSGWWLLLSFVPIIGSIVLIVFFCLASGSDNRFGSAPN